MLPAQQSRRLRCIFPAFTLLPKHYSTNTAVGATMKRVLVPVANGSEEIEAVSIIDTLRRAGADVTGTFLRFSVHLHSFLLNKFCTVASVEDSLQVTCSRKTKLVADALIVECLESQYDLIALPGAALSFPSQFFESNQVHLT